jgi:hypothetical protein
MAYLALMSLIVAGIGTPGLAAQDEPTLAPSCTAMVLPEAIDADQRAVRLMVTLPESIGADVAFEPAEDSGISLADAEDLPRVPMAAGEPPSRAIDLSTEGNRLTLWLNTASASAGTYDFILKGSGGTCTGHVTINPRSDALGR